MADKSLPACSSDQAVRALKRCGFIEKRTSGDHMTLRRETPPPSKTTVVKLGEKRIPNGTLKKILNLASVTVEEFKKHLK